MTDFLQLLQHNLYILTTSNDRGAYSAIPVSWVTQTSSSPILLGVALKTGTYAEQIVLESQRFALHFWTKDQTDLVQKLFQKTERVAGRINGLSFEIGSSGAPLLKDAAAYLDFRVDSTLIRGDHSFVLGQLLQSHARAPLKQQALLSLRDLDDSLSTYR